MNVNDAEVLEMINRLIAIDRLDKIQVLQVVKLASVSCNLNELKDYIKWEYFKNKI